MPGFEAGPNFKGSDEEKELQGMELHNIGLHDQNEDAAGEKVDLATGRKYDNSTSTGMEQLRVVEGDRESEDALGALPEEEDAAAKWLREHGQNDIKKAS